LIVIANINIIYGITEKLRLTVKVCFINNIFQKVLSIPKIYFIMTNIDSFDTFERERFLNFNFLTWTGLRHAVPLNLRTHPPSFTVVLDPENCKCCDYYSFLIKFKYEKPKKRAKIAEEFDL